jgi:hypothetical protein
MSCANSSMRWKIHRCCASCASLDWQGNPMNYRLLSLLVVVLAAAGCSGEKADGDAPAAVKAPVAAVAEAVAAVLQSGGTPVAKLGFVVLTVPALQVLTEGEAINIDPATAQASVSLEAGKTASHTVRLTPQREGLTRVTVRLRSATDSAETVYDIPVLVGAAATGG